MTGRVPTREEAVALSFMFGSMGPFHRFTTYRESNGPYRDFRKQVEPLLSHRPEVRIFFDMEGFASVRE